MLDETYLDCWESGYLVFDHRARARAEATSRAKPVGDGTDQHIDFRCLKMARLELGTFSWVETYRDVVEFSQTASGSPYSAKRYSFIEHEPEFMLGFEFDLVQIFVIKNETKKEGRKRTSFGRSTIAPSFSKIPSVTINRRVKGALRFRRSFSTLSSTSSRLVRSLWLYHLTVDREIWMPF